MERIGITRLVTKQSTSSFSLRHVTDCWLKGRNVGRGNDRVTSLQNGHVYGYNYIWIEGGGRYLVCT